MCGGGLWSCTALHHHPNTLELLARVPAVGWARDGAPPRHAVADPHLPQFGVPQCALGRCGARILVTELNAAALADVVRGVVVLPGIYTQLAAADGAGEGVVVVGWHGGQAVMWDFRGLWGLWAMRCPC